MPNLIETATNYFNASENARVIAARMVGLKRSADGSRFVKAGKPAITIADTYEKRGDPEVYTQLRTGFIASRSEGFGRTFAGFTLAEIKGMDRDAVKAHKLRLSGGNKKPVTKAQKAAVDKFKAAQDRANNIISTGMANFRNQLVSLLAPFETKTVAPNKAPKAETAKGKDSQTGGVSTDTHVESGPVTEVKTSPVPRSIQHPVLIELVNKLAAFDVGQQGVIAESQAVQNLLEGLTHTLNVNRIRARDAAREAASEAK